MRILRAMLGIVFVATTASSCIIGGDEPWDDNAGSTDSDGDTDVDSDTDTDTDTDTGPDGDSDTDVDSDDDNTGLEAANDGSLHLVPDGGVDAGTDAG